MADPGLNDLERTVLQKAEKVTQKSKATAEVELEDIDGSD